MGKIAEKIKRTLFTSDFRRQTVLVTLPSLFLDFIFILFNFYMGLYTVSLWYMTMCIYYIILTLMRLNVLGRSTKALFSRDKIKAYTRLYRSTHRFLLFLTLMLAGAIFFLLRNNVWKNYPGILIYFIGAYTLYKVTASIINLIKARKVNSITTILLRKIGHADALVSLLILESAFIGRSGRAQGFKMQDLATKSGAVVCGILFIISVSGLLKSKSRIEEKINLKSDK